MLPGGGTGPQLGAQFAQLVKELRSEYGGAVSAAASRISAALFAAPGRSILRILEQHGVTGTPALMQQQVRGIQASAMSSCTWGGLSCASWSSMGLPAYRRPCGGACLQVVCMRAWRSVLLPKVLTPGTLSDAVRLCLVLDTINQLRQHVLGSWECVSGLCADLCHAA